jgi:hypothetical protein
MNTESIDKKILKYVESSLADSSRFTIRLIDDDGSAYLEITQVIPLGKKQINFVYIIRVDKINSNFLCRGRLPFCFKVDDIADWNKLQEVLKDAMRSIYDSLQSEVRLDLLDSQPEWPKIVSAELCLSVKVRSYSEENVLILFADIWPVIHASIAEFYGKAKETGRLVSCP